MKTLKELQVHLYTSSRKNAKYISKSVFIHYDRLYRLDDIMDKYTL